MWQGWWTNVYKQMAIAFGWYTIEYSTEDEGVETISTMSALSASMFLWAPVAAGRVAGYGLGVGAIGYVGGALVLQLGVWAFGDEEDMVNSTEFVMGQGNYLTGDPLGSGYFNVPSNVKRIYDHTDWRATSGMKTGSPEHAQYERDYWSQWSDQSEKFHRSQTSR